MSKVVFELQISIQIRDRGYWMSVLVYINVFKR